MRRYGTAMIFVGLLVGACIFGGSTSVTDDPQDSILPPPSETPSTLPMPRGIRSYELAVPPNVEGRGPAPLILSFHDEGETPAAHAESTGLADLARTEGFVVASPRAVDGTWDFEDRDETDRPDVDDVRFVREMIDEIAETVPIDPDRVYATGLQMGGGFATLLACRMPDRIAAVAVVGAPVHHDGPACGDPKPARVLVIVGERSWAVVPGGIPPDLPLADPPGRLDEEIVDWVHTNRCRPTPEETVPSGEVRRSVYDCRKGAALEVYLHPGGFFWPKEEVWGIDATSTIWRFFDMYDAPIPEGEDLSAAEASFIDSAQVAVGPGVALTSSDGSLSPLGETILDVGYWACIVPVPEFETRFLGEVDMRGMAGDAPTGVRDAAMEHLCR